MRVIKTITPDGKELIFETIKLAALELELQPSLINFVLRGKRPHTKGYVFYYVNE